jgi:hypothetical protein
MRISFFKRDRPRPIDRYIDFFGGAACIVAGLAVAGCAGLTSLSDEGGVVTHAPAASVVDAALSRRRNRSGGLHGLRARSGLFAGLEGGRLGRSGAYRRPAGESRGAGGRGRHPADRLVDERGDAPHAATGHARGRPRPEGLAPVRHQRADARAAESGVRRVHMYQFPQHGGRNAVGPDALGPASRTNNEPAKETIQ